MRAVSLLLYSLKHTSPKNETARKEVGSQIKNSYFSFYLTLEIMNEKSLRNIHVFSDMGLGGKEKGYTAKKGVSITLTGFSICFPILLMTCAMSVCFYCQTCPVWNCLEVAFSASHFHWQLSSPVQKLCVFITISQNSCTASRGALCFCAAELSLPQYL